MEQIFRKELMDFFHGKTLPFSVDNIIYSIVSYALCFFKPSQVIGETTWNNCISRQVTEDNWIFAKRGVVYRRKMCYTQSMEQLWTLLLLGRVWGRHAPTRSLGKLARVWEVKSRMDRKFSRIENLWPRDGSCPLPLRSKPFLGNCFRIVKAQKISRGCAAHVCGSPFAPNAVPAPVLQRRWPKSRYHARTAHEILKVRLPQKENTAHAVEAKDFVGWNRRQNDRVCCGAVNLRRK